MNEPIKDIKIESNNRIKTAAVFSYFLIILNILFGVIYLPWIISNVGKSSYAIYTLTLSIISFFSIDFGLGETISRYVSKYKFENNDDKMRELFNAITKIFLVIASVIFLSLMVIYFNIDKIYAELTQNELSKFKNVFIFSALFCSYHVFFSPFNGILIGNGRFIFIKIVELINKLTIIVATTIALVFDFDVYGLVFAYIAAGTVTIIVKFIYILKNRLFDFKIVKVSKKMYKSIITFSGWTMIVIVAQRLTYNIVPSLLGFFSGTNEIALFTIALSIEGYIWTFSNALNGLFLPKITKLNIDGKIDEINQTMVSVGRFQLFFMGLIILGFYLLGPEFVNLWVGADLESAAFVGFFLVAAGLFTYTFGIAYTYLLVVKKVKYYAVSLVISLVITLISAIFLIPNYGALGAAISIFIGSMIGQVIIMSIFYHKIIGFNMLNFYKKVHLRSIIPMVVTFAFGIFVKQVIDEFSIKNLVVKIVLISLVYVVFSFVCILTKEERNRVLKFRWSSLWKKN
ncbi:MAG: oligosaccharide flippase family protein [Bacilli bacterium]|nr:oligosaccharide flippase family protein [Bacilli bacterium]